MIERKLLTVPSPNKKKSSLIKKKKKKEKGMLHIISLSFFCLPKLDVALKITIKFMIDHY